MLLPVIWVESQKFSLLQWMKPGLKKSLSLYYF